ncbi:MAG: nucleotidyl transferase AbiEii/AbiGii toxin family protein [Gammaproteobacteria bacterium]|nr:nucleotidyl transferase AbiEii/AbiGii toxin family protein [Gammaproteobacteria bacterium]
MLPLIAHEKEFALKGGTAINMFVRDMPRLSVDIDLTYLPIEPRDEALTNLRAAMQRIAQRIEQQLRDVRVHQQQTKSADDHKLLVQQGREKIIIETSPVMRGAIKPPVVLQVQKQVERTFGYARMAVLSFEDLYAGKICAALDRQHPRDLFDVKVLYEHEGFKKPLHEAFLVYLLCGNRPIAEILKPKLQDLGAVYERQFVGMTMHDVSLDELETMRETLTLDINRLLTQKQKQFLLSFKQGDPDWSLLSLKVIEKLPAIQWKLHN